MLIGLNIFFITPLDPVTVLLHESTTSALIRTGDPDFLGGGESLLTLRDRYEKMFLESFEVVLLK